MSPLIFLASLVLVTSICGLAQMFSRRRRTRALQQLAGEWKMHYTPSDRFQLAARVAQILPVPGAAAVRVLDLIYGIEGDRYRYLLTAEFTSGVLRRKTRSQIVTSFSEPRDRSASADTLQPIFAPASLPPIEQYRHLYEQITPRSADAASDNAAHEKGGPREGPP